MSLDLLHVSCIRSSREETTLRTLAKWLVGLQNLTVFRVRTCNISHVGSHFPTILTIPTITNTHSVLQKLSNFPALPLLSLNCTLSKRSTNIAFTVDEATTHAEFISIVRVEAESYSNPPNTFWEVMKGPSLDECTSRQAQWNEIDPSSHWIYAKDAQTDEIVGAMNWNIHEKNPYASAGEGPPFYWWPESL